jgi:SsrA-binding protein
MVNKKQNTAVCQNRKARFEYEILESLECGIELLGSEIKSVRNFKVSIDASYAMIHDSEIWLFDCNIDPYKNAAFPHEPKRKRKLLLKKREIRQFAEKAEQRGNTLIPLKMYLKDGRCKVELAVCRGKQVHDKRQAQKEKDAVREMKEY